MTGAARPLLWRALLAMAGLGLVAYLVHSAGAGKIVRVLGQAAWWLPIIFTLELAQVGSDVLALRLLLRGVAGRVPALTWLRSSAIAYAAMILIPAGRATGEVARATLVARHVGGPRAATAAAQLHSSYLFANGVLSATACLVVANWLGPRSRLALILGCNALLMAALATTVLAVLRGGRAGRWLERTRRRFPGGTHPAPPLEPHSRRRLPWRAAVVCTTSRGAQVVQYGVILAAVGGVASVRGAFIAHGIHLVGATVGDLLPNQLGAVDGAFRAFARNVGFGDAPARALSIAFVAHATQLLCAGACIVVAAVTRGPSGGGAPVRALEHHDGPASD
jgi:lysylphosphatidylglycerol synthase-like protein